MNAIETTVANIRRRKPGPWSLTDAYVGRKTSCPRGFSGPGVDGIFGNGFTVREHGESALDLFRRYFLDRVNTDVRFRAAVLQLRGFTLWCFCAPGPCHAQIIADYINQHFGDA